MCAIAGCVHAGPLRPEALVLAMTDAMAHRGPDDRGVLSRPGVALGHRRLAIIDVAGGRQPLSNEDGSVWIVYNGEVYNHGELRGELEARGHVFRTRSDTETIVHAYEEDGPGCVRRLRGMFAFAIWDQPRRRLVLARDRLGIKPLYYARTPQGLLFASDLRALLLAPEVDRTIDEDALSCYLALRYVPAPATLLRGVRKLPPASVLTWEASAPGEPRIERYWSILDAGAPPHGDGDGDGGGHPVSTEAEEAARLRERIDESVRLRLMSEVPLGAFLSGGLDSTLVTAAMAVTGGAPPRTFSVGYEEGSPDSELAWAALAAHTLGTRHREVQVTPAEAALHLPEIVRALDEPVADPAAVPLWFLARRAREEVTVVLSGEGGDEAFGGYAMYRWMSEMERLRALGLGEALALLGGLAPSARVRRAAGLLRRPLEERYRGVSRAFDGEGLARLVGREAAAAADRAVAAALAPHWEASRGLSPLRRMLHLDLQVWLPDDLLVKADKMTMASAVELRVPLLDHRLMEHAWALPDDLKVRGAEGKYLLRRAARGRAPEAVLRRRKMGFATPTAAWLREPAARLLEEALLDPRSLCRERLRAPAVTDLLDEHRARRADHSPELWTLLVLELWRREVASTPALREEALAEVS